MNQMSITEANPLESRTCLLLLWPPLSFNFQTEFARIAEDVSKFS